MALSGVPEAFQKLFVEGQLIEDRYLLKRILGRGGFAEVWKAYDQKESRDVGLKVLFNNKIDQATARFEQEWRILSNLPKGGTIEVYGRGQCQDFPFMVMEFLPGRDLAREISLRGKLPCAEVLHVMLAVAEALEVVHRGQVCHRDVKPGNIYLQDVEGLGTRRVRLLDLGIAKDQRSLDGPVQTQAHIYLGTPFYSAPETYYQRATPASDIYSLGCVGFYALAGIRPFGGQRGNLSLHQWKSEAIKAHLSGPVPSILDFDPSAPQELARLFQKMLVKSPDARPGIGAVVAVLNRIAEKYFEGRVELSQRAPSSPVNINTDSKTAAESFFYFIEGISQQLGAAPIESQGFELRNLVPGEVPIYQEGIESHSTPVGATNSEEVGDTLWEELSSGAGEVMADFKTYGDGTLPNYLEEPAESLETWKTYPGPGSSERAETTLAQEETAFSEDSEHEPTTLAVEEQAFSEGSEHEPTALGQSQAQAWEGETGSQDSAGAPKPEALDSTRPSELPAAKSLAPLEPSAQAEEQWDDTSPTVAPEQPALNPATPTVVDPAMQAGVGPYLMEAPLPQPRILSVYQPVHQSTPVGRAPQPQSSQKMLFRLVAVALIVVGLLVGLTIFGWMREGRIGSLIGNTAVEIDSQPLEIPVQPLQKNE